MAVMGLWELILILAMFGVTPGGAELNPTAPRDSLHQAMKHLVQDPVLVFHGNLETSGANLVALLDQVQTLDLVRGNPEVLQGLSGARMMLMSQLMQIQMTIGLDLLHDVGSFTISATMDQEGNPEVLAWVRGNFQRDIFRQKLESLLEKAGSAGDQPLYLLESGNEMVLTLANDTTAVLGTRAQVLRALNRTAPLAGKIGDDLRFILGSRIADKAAALLARPLPTAMMDAARVAVGRDSALIYLRCPEFLIKQLAREDDQGDGAALIRFFMDLEYVAFLNSRSGGTMYLKSRSPWTTRLTFHLAKVLEQGTLASDPLLEGLVHLVLGVTPLLPDHEIRPLTRATLEDEASIRQAADWLKTTFLGPVRVRLSMPANLVRVETRSPVGLALALMPMTAFYFATERAPAPSRKPDFHEQDYDLGEVEVNKTTEVKSPAMDYPGQEAVVDKWAHPGMRVEDPKEQDDEQ